MARFVPPREDLKGFRIHTRGRRVANARTDLPDNSVFEAELQDVIPICRATIAGTRVVGRLTAGLVDSQPVVSNSLNKC